MGLATNNQGAQNIYDLETRNIDIFYWKTGTGFLGKNVIISKFDKEIIAMFISQVEQSKR